jgi:hypothetical protein
METLDWALCPWTSLLVDDPEVVPLLFYLQRHPILFNKRDVETIQKMSQVPMPDEVKLPFYLFSDGLWPVMTKSCVFVCAA